MILPVDHFFFGSSIISISFSLAKQAVAIDDTLGDVDQCFTRVT
jgi:hypothetical protein